MFSPSPEEKVQPVDVEETHLQGFADVTLNTLLPTQDAVNGLAERRCVQGLALRFLQVGGGSNVQATLRIDDSSADPRPTRNMRPHAGSWAVVRLSVVDDSLGGRTPETRWCGFPHSMYLSSLVHRQEAELVS
jgi:hypothetical protein